MARKQATGKPDLDPQDLLTIAAEEFELSPSQRHLLVIAVEALQDARMFRATWQAGELIVEDRFEQERVNVAVEQERKSKTLAMRALDALGLDEYAKQYSQASSTNGTTRRLRFAQG